MRRYLLYLALLAGMGCGGFDIAETRNITKLEREVSTVRTEAPKPTYIMPFDIDFSKYESPFFVFLYHLEQNSTKYAIDNKELAEFFGDKDADPIFPLSALEKMIKEGDTLQLCNRAFSGTLPGTYSQVFLDVSENLQFRVVKKPGRIDMHLTAGYMKVRGTDIAGAANFRDFDCNFIVLYPGDDDFSVLFGKKGRCLVRGYKLWLESAEFGKVEGRRLD